MDIKNHNLRVIDEITLYDFIKGTLPPADKRRVEILLKLEQNRKNLEEAELIYSEEQEKNIVSEKNSPYSPPENSDFESDTTRQIRLLKEKVLSNKVAKPTPRKNTNSIQPTAGQIWSVKKDIEGFDKTSLLPLAQSPMIYLLTNPEVLFFEDVDSQECVKMYQEYMYVEFLPVSLNVEYATNTSIILDGENSPLGLPCAIETTVCSSITVPNLRKCLGELDQESVEKLLNLYAFSIDANYDVELYESTQTGSDTWADDSEIAEFLDVQNENAEILTETVYSVYENFAIHSFSLNRPIVELSEAMTGSESVSPVPAGLPDAESTICEDEKMLLRLETYAGKGYFIYMAFNGFKDDKSYKLVIRSITEDGFSREIELNPRTFNRFRLPVGLKPGYYEFAIIENGEKLYFKVAKVDLK